ncbi:hypothetical protein D3C71_2013040 [compost metagenome]
MADGVQQVGQGRLQVGGGRNAQGFRRRLDDNLGHGNRHLHAHLQYFGRLRVVQPSAGSDAEQGQGEQPRAGQEEGD